MNAQLELRKIMNDEITRAKSVNPSYSLRAFARKVGLQPSALSEILSGKRHITRKMAAKVLERLCVGPEKTKNLLAKLSNKKTSPPTDTHGDFVQINMDHYHIISEWYYFGILSLAETKGFKGNPDWIANRLGITTTEAKNALKRLERLELLKRNSKNQLVWSGQHFTTSNDIVNMALRKSHYQNLELAKKSLDTVDLSERDFSSMTMAIDTKKIPETKKMIQAFRRNLSEFLESGEKSEVYRICLQLFPLSTKGDTK